MTQSRRIALALAAVGAGFCFFRVVGFFRIIQGNELPWAGASRFTQAHYQAVGKSYSQGFAAGFFLCFSLAVIAAIVGTWYEANRDRKKRAHALSAETTHVVCQEG